MPVIWDTPFPSGTPLFGPGFRIQLNSTLSNSTSQPFTWRVQVWDGNNEIGPSAIMCFIAGVLRVAEALRIGASQSPRLKRTT